LEKVVEAIKNVFRRTLSADARAKVKIKTRWVLVGINLISSRFHTTKDIWHHRIPSELTFWDYWLTSHGATAPADYLRRIDPMCEISEPAASFIKSAHCKILDVGAGPLTILGKMYKGQRLDITAVDVLGDEYALLLEKHGITPSVKTHSLESEKLAERFAHNSFDISYAENTLDHSYDPVLAIEQMLNVTKCGGAVILVHSPNEGSDSCYLGLHQWNFKIADGDFVISSPGRPTVNISKRLRDRANIRVGTRPADGSIVVTMVKAH
jgi:SAM-dependent methyltransferase